MRWPVSGVMNVVDLVTCGTCTHFTPDSIGNGSGVGECAVDGEGVRYEALAPIWKDQRPQWAYRGLGLYPRAERKCSDYGERA